MKLEPIRVPVDKHSGATGASHRDASSDHATVHEPNPDLESALDDARTEVEALRAENLRLLADQQHFRRRIEKLYETRLQEEKDDLLRRFLSVADSLERALRYARPADGLSEGVRLTYKRLVSILSAEGVEPIDALGDSFDPALHEAISVAQGYKEPGIVVQEERKGYTQNGRLLRPSRVVVSAS